MRIKEVNIWKVFKVLSIATGALSMLCNGGRKCNKTCPFPHELLVLMGKIITSWDDLSHSREKNRAHRGTRQEHLPTVGTFTRSNA